jgi:hypothetical protein
MSDLGDYFLKCIIRELEVEYDKHVSLYSIYSLTKDDYIKYRIEDITQRIVAETPIPPHMR